MTTASAGRTLKLTTWCKVQTVQEVRIILKQNAFFGVNANKVQTLNASTGSTEQSPDTECQYRKY